MSATGCPLCKPPEAVSNTRDEIKCSLYLRAVLPTLCDLVQWDAEAKAIIKDKKLSILFSVKNGEKTFLQIQDGTIKYFDHKPESPSISLLFWDSIHAVQVFEQNKMPIPVKGFTKLGFMKNDFAQLTRRLEYFLKGNQNYTDEDRKKSVVLQLKMAVRSAEVLGEKEEVSQKILRGTPRGTLKIRVEDIGFEVFFGYKDNKWQFIDQLDRVSSPISAELILVDVRTAELLLSNQLDTFVGLGLGTVRIAGIIPIIDNVGLVLGRIPLYIS